MAGGHVTCHIVGVLYLAIVFGLIGTTLYRPATTPALANGYLRNLLHSIVMGATLLPCLKKTQCNCITGSTAKALESVGIVPNGLR